MIASRAVSPTRGGPYLEDVSHSPGPFLGLDDFLVRGKFPRFPVHDSGDDAFRGRLLIRLRAFGCGFPGHGPREIAFPAARHSHIEALARERIADVKVGNVDCPALGDVDIARVGQLRALDEVGPRDHELARPSALGQGPDRDGIAVLPSHDPDRVAVGEPAASSVDRAVQPRPEKVTGPRLVPVRERGARVLHEAEPDEAGLHARRQLCGLLVRTRQEKNVLPLEHAREVGPGRPVHRGLAVESLEPCTGRVGRQGRLVSVVQAQGRVRLPGLREPVDLAQLGRPQPLRQGPEHPSGSDGSELLGVAGGDEGGTVPVGEPQHEVKVRGRDLAGLVQDQLVTGLDPDGVAELVRALDLAQERGDVVRGRQPLRGHHPRRVLRRSPGR